MGLPPDRILAVPSARGTLRKDSADSVRALSALVVVVSHAVQIIWLPVDGLGTPLHRINSFLSDTAVIVFFVLSGFLISASIGANVARNGGRFRLVDFAAARSLRIMPPLLFAIVLSCGLFLLMSALQLPGIGRPLAAPGDLYTARDTLSVTTADVWNALMMSNGLLVMNGPLWSLYVEVKLYVIAGLLAYLVWGRWPPPVRVAMVAMSLWAAYVYGFGIVRPHWFYCCWWGLGAAFYVAGRPEPRLRGGGIVAIIVAAGAALAVTPMAAGLELPRIVFVVGLSVLMFYVWRWSEPLTRSVAGYSYTLYLTHFPILIFAYALLVAGAGETTPSLTARAAAALLGIAAALSCSLLAARRLEDTASIRMILLAVLGRAQRPA